MARLSLAPLATSEAEAYWRVYVSGRTDVPSPAPQAHLERYLSLPPEEQRTHFAIREDGRLVGTVRLLPGTIVGFSMDPGHREAAARAIVQAIDLLRTHGAAAITASYDESYGPVFESLGFGRLFARMRMEAEPRRAAAAGVPLRPPEEAEVLGLASFFRDVYAGHREQAYGMHVGDDEDWRGYVTGILRGETGRFMPDASFVSLEGTRIVGAILVSHWMGSPLVAEVGVAKDRRRRGVGRALLEAASSRLAALGEPRWALYVTLGNDPAIGLYRSLGFTQAGAQTVTGVLPPP